MKTVKKDLKTAKDSINKLKKKEYACEKDANRAAEIWLSKHQRYEFKELSIELKSRRMKGKRGRPKKDEELETYFEKIPAESK